MCLPSPPPTPAHYISSDLFPNAAALGGDDAARSFSALDILSDALHTRNAVDLSLRLIIAHHVVQSLFTLLVTHFLTPIWLIHVCKTTHSILGI